MKLSIITVNYNNRDGLQKTIDSVICQTWRDFEWIIIDGGSTDGSKELITNLNDNPSANLSYWCSEPDKGIYNAMNKGVKQSEGEYVIFMNSGDVFYSNEALYNLFTTSHGADIISGYSMKNGKDEVMHRHRENLFFQLIFSTISHQATIIRRQLLKKHPYDEHYKIVSDWKFWLEAIIIDGCSFEFSEVVVSEQDMTGISTSRGNMELEYDERHSVISSLFSEMMKNNINTLYQYEIIPTSKYIVSLNKKSPKIFVIVHRITRLLSWFVGIKNENDARLWKKKSIEQLEVKLD